MYLLQTCCLLSLQAILLLLLAILLLLLAILLLLLAIFVIIIGYIAIIVEPIDYLRIEKVTGIEMYWKRCAACLYYHTWLLLKTTRVVYTYWFRCTHLLANLLCHRTGVDEFYVNISQVQIQIAFVCCIELIKVPLRDVSNMTKSVYVCGSCYQRCVDNSP